MIAPGVWCLTQTEDAIRQAIAQSTAFQQWTGAANETEALEHVKIDEDDPPLNGIYYSAGEIASRFPMVIIEPDQDGESFIWEHVSDRKGYGKGWAFNLRFLSVLVGVKPLGEERRDFKNDVGQIMEDLKDHPETRIATLKPIEFPVVDHPQDEENAGRFWQWLWDIRDTTQIEL